MNYSGPVRIEVNGALLTVGTASVDDDADGGWGGELSVLNGTGVAGKALVVDLVMGDLSARAQLIPERVEGETAISRVVGIATG